MARLIHVITTGAGIGVYFLIVYLSVNISIVGMQEKYSIGDTIEFTATVSGIGSSLYSYSVEFEGEDGHGLRSFHHSGSGPTYLDPPLYFSEEIKYNEQIEWDEEPGNYVMRFNALGHSVEKQIVVLP